MATINELAYKFFELMEVKLEVYPGFEIASYRCSYPSFVVAYTHRDTYASFDINFHPKNYKIIIKEEDISSLVFGIDPVFKQIHNYNSVEDLIEIVMSYVEKLKSGVEAS